MRQQGFGRGEIDLWVSGPAHVVAELLDEALRDAGARSHDGWFELPLGGHGAGRIVQLRASGRTEPVAGGVRLHAALEEAPISRWSLWGAWAVLASWGLLNAIGGDLASVPVALLGAGFLGAMRAWMLPHQRARGEAELRALTQRVQALADHHAQLSAGGGIVPTGPETRGA